MRLCTKNKRFQRTVSADVANAAVSSGHCHIHKQPLPPLTRVCLARALNVPEHVAFRHKRAVSPTQCYSVVETEIHAPASAVWAILRRFDSPQSYKHFVRSCHVVLGDGVRVGSVREVRVVSGLPAGFSVERLEILDEERHVISFSVVGGDHRLENYRSVTTVHESPDGKVTRVVESYIVDVPVGNTKEETCSFVDTIVRCNLQSLARLAENSPKTAQKTS
ncbi:PREDICTED: abscisic acid receptor PYL6-like isoform X2 [Tarenaya hassleriana]|uniref:abscisic acid receptor PYL6-like isoform X2 n=1 Tax=Tarenaya hassleriana TaxID=28532 RepID=UPI00053C3600|nr:PREDICTED: abscisic acid receptor PYL6-like isoform X2 [Tarenaya hassleriana]